MDAPTVSMLLLSLLAIGGCGDGASPAADAGPASDAAPPTDRRPVDLPVLPDLDPDPDVVEVELIAGHTHSWDLGDGRSPHATAYNGFNPGPILEAKLGDRIIVHFRNMLLWPTTVHWHGLRVPNAMDGSHTTQEPVPADGAFTYEFEARDVGLFWYHPHLHEGVQIDLGLYGPIVIHGAGEPEVALDQLLVLDDMLLGDDGEMLGVDPHAEEPHDTHAMAGASPERMGNTLLANGVVNLDVPVTRGSWVLFRLLNVATTRIFGMRLEDHRFVVVGTDGGFLAEPWETDFLPIGVGERYLVLVQMTGNAGQRYAWTHEPQPEDPFADDPLPEGPHVMATVTYGGGEVPMTARPAVVTGDAPAMAPAATIDHTWILSTIFRGGDFVNAIDGEIWPDIPLQTYRRDGDYTFVIENRDDGPHPFHTHGNRFQVVQRNGADVDERGWKDTVLLPGMSSIMIRSVLDNPGRWMYHCHILAHQEEGMMAEMVVE